MSEYKIINSEVVNLYQKKSFRSEVVSQGLLWENVEILEKCNNWWKIKQWDKYVSFIHKKNLVNGGFYIDNNLQDDSISQRFEGLLDEREQESLQARIDLFLKFGKYPSLG